MHDARNNLSNPVVADVRQNSREKVYDTVIPRNVRVSEAPSYGKPVLVYDLKCVGSEAYLRLATEIIQREKELIVMRAGKPSTAAAREHLNLHHEMMSPREHGCAMADDSRSRLGRGLAALMGDVVAETQAVGKVSRIIGASRSSISSPTRATPAATLPMASSRSWPPRSRSAV